MLRCHRISPSCNSSAGVSPAAVADARCPGWTWAMTVRTGCRSSQSKSPRTASLARYDKLAVRYGATAPVPA